MKISLLITSLFLSLFLHAQIKKGALFIGGDVQVYGTKYQSAVPGIYNRHSNNYYFSPSIGWVFKDNVLVGGKLSVSFFNDTDKNPSDYDTKGNRVGAGIWMRKYLPLGKSFYLFGDAAVNAQSIYRKEIRSQQPSYYKEKGYAVSAAVFPGISYQIRKSVFIEAALNNLITFGYERRTMEQQGTAVNMIKGVTNSYSLSSSFGNGIPLQIGIRWIMAQK